MQNVAFMDANNLTEWRSNEWPPAAAPASKDVLQPPAAQVGTRICGAANDAAAAGSGQETAP